MKDIQEIIDKKVKEVTKKQGELVENIIAKIICENDCKPSDIHILVKGGINYTFLVKKQELEMTLDFMETLEE